MENWRVDILQRETPASLYLLAQSSSSTIVFCITSDSDTRSSTGIGLDVGRRRAEVQVLEWFRVGLAAAELIKPQLPVILVSGGPRGLQSGKNVHLPLSHALCHRSPIRDPSNSAERADLGLLTVFS